MRLGSIAARESDTGPKEWVWLEGWEFVRRLVWGNSFRQRKIARHHGVVPLCSNGIGLVLLRIRQPGKRFAGDRGRSALGKLDVGKTNPTLHQTGLELQ